MWIYSSKCSAVNHIYTHTPMGFPGGASGKEPVCQCRRHKRRGFDLRVRKIPLEEGMKPTPVFSPGDSHGQRSLAGCSPQGCKEVDTTEATWLCTHAPSISPLHPLRQNTLHWISWIPVFTRFLDYLLKSDNHCSWKCILRVGEVLLFIGIQLLSAFPPLR